jgi:hypothetical protein
VANREKEIGQELVDRQAKADRDEATRVAQKETEDLSRGRLIVRSSTSDGGESS